jgi:HAD superfamily hydrolase (TIGR01509 family)
MTIKLIVFDLDGTLVESRDMHYRTLNDALPLDYRLSMDEHLSTYDGLPTKKKLELLTKLKGLPVELHNNIWETKQEFTTHEIQRYERDARICEVLASLKRLGYLVYIASNCTWKNASLIISKKGFMEHIDWFVTNEDVRRPKPSPEMYLSCMARANVSPSECLIVEDSPIGKESALKSGGTLHSVSCPSDVTLESILRVAEGPKRLNVVIPMAGLGSRFQSAGYTIPKPLIDVNGKPMIQLVVENLKVDARFIFIVQTEHCEKYNIHKFLEKIAPGCVIIPVTAVTEGACCSVLLAKEYIDNDTHLLIANSDQYVEWDSNAFLSQAKDVDGAIATFESSHPKWSYVKIGDDGFASEVAEKRVISNKATVGIYYYACGADFVKYAERMIKKNVRVNNEFYVCPVFNEFIEDGKRIQAVDVNRMWGLGTPEDLDVYLGSI